MSTPERQMREDVESVPDDNLDLVKALDELSLEQALIDVEIANARVMDLASRLLAARQELLMAKEQAAFYRDCVVALEAELEAINRSRTYKLAKGIHKVGKLIR
jgi:hypothetical protein